MEIELPDPPPPVPKPKLWEAVFCSGTLIFVSQFMYFTAADKAAAFFAGVLSTVAGVNAANYLAERRQARNLQAQLDEMYEQVKLRVTMLPKLVERHGPDQALEIISMADHLVDEGDFDDIKEAVASIERHHDLEPTVFED